MDTAARVADGDLSLFSIETQTSPADRKSLLLLQHIVASHYGEHRYRYLEIGSFVGGSIVPHLVDPRCERIVSVDARMPLQPDERGVSFRYNDNSTAAMIENLRRAAPDADVAKLRTIDGTSARLTPGAVGSGIRYALIDGEHTNRAAFADFVNVLRLVETDAIIAFHDANLLVDTVWNVAPFLSYIGRPHEIILLPDVVAVVALGQMIEPVRAATAGVRLHAEAFYQSSKRGLIDFHRKLPNRAAQDAGLGETLVMRRLPEAAAPPAAEQPANDADAATAGPADGAVGSSAADSARPAVPAKPKGSVGKARATADAK